MPAPAEIGGAEGGESSGLSLDPLPPEPAGMRSRAPDAEVSAVERNAEPLWCEPVGALEEIGAGLGAKSVTNHRNTSTAKGTPKSSKARGSRVEVLEASLCTLTLR